MTTTIITPESSNGKQDTSTGRAATMPAHKVGVVQPQNTAALTGFAQDSTDKDPFVDNGCITKPNSGLSALSETFHPGQTISSLNIRLELSDGPPIVGDLGQHTAKDHEDIRKQDLVPLNGTKTIEIQQEGVFSTMLGITRAILITSTHIQLSGAEIEDTIATGVSYYAGYRILKAGNQFFLRIPDVRDAQVIHGKIRALHPDWTVQYCMPNYAAQVTGMPYVSPNESRVAVIALMPPVASSRQGFETALVKQLELEGPLFARSVRMSSNNAIEIIVEFANVLHAGQAIDHLNGMDIMDITLSVAHYRPELEDNFLTRGFSTTPARGAEVDVLKRSMQGLGWNDDPVVSQYSYNANGAGQIMSINPGQLQQPGSGAFSPVQSGLHEHTQGSGRGHAVYGYTPPATNSSYSSRVLQEYETPQRAQHRNQFLLGTDTHYSSQYSNSGAPSGVRVHNQYGGSPSSKKDNHNNIVSINRIIKGADVRTTIMLRNIPNKIDQPLLKAIVDETSYGKYDFMYLRMDFAHQCNVGYAFINFTEPDHIINFVQKRAGKKWDLYNSGKVCEVSYATIQGRDCLIAKFRNSSIMMEQPNFRPKLFYAEGEDLVGEEEEFPHPDNNLKMRRSLENAEHNGLFAPRSGHQYREDEKRRYSHYDRGTRHAEQEELDRLNGYYLY